MGCACGTKSKDGKVSGCNNNGACGTGGCNKMNVFDWLSNMEMPSSDRFNVAEIRFKNGRKDFYRNSDNITLHTGDPVVVEAMTGHHIGYVSMQGELVRLQMQKKKVANDDEIKKIYRLAHTKDLEKFEEVKNRELPSLYHAREAIRRLKLTMKLSDVEFQADNTKAVFYYSAEDRVDFRELIKVLATDFKVRVEMRQISLRQEAGRLGGVGVCGRELCCSTWLSDFKNVATSAARYQNLSLNPSKLSGQCGRLKCCLNYELETYMEALKFIPEVETPLLTEKGEARLQKTDIFRKIMWFAYKEENNWYALNVDRVNEILELNRSGKKPASLELDQEEVKVPVSTLNSDLENLDKKFQNKNKKSRNKNRRAGNERKDQGRPNSGNQQNPNQNQRNQPQNNQKNQPRNNQRQGNQNQNNPKQGGQRPGNQRPNNPNQGGQQSGNPRPNNPNQNRPNPNRDK